jgi:hypothetical protein
VAARTHLSMQEFPTRRDCRDDLRASPEQIEDVLADLQARAVRLQQPVSPARDRT